MVEKTQALLLVAGEASADAHGARVLLALQKNRPNVRAFGIGGPALRAAGLEAVADAEDIAVAGLTEVLSAIPRIWRILRRLEATAKERRPKAALLIDLPDFNLRLAARLKRLGIRVIYYISPQIWAWRPKRVETIRRVVDTMLVILPFEEAFFRERGIAAQFVGHPLVEAQSDEAVPNDTIAARDALALAHCKGPVIALLPGSRRAEIARHLTPMLQALQILASLYPGIQGVLPLAPTVSRSWLEPQLALCRTPVSVVDGRAAMSLSACDVAIVCSGTATLQTALLGRPMVVVYRVSSLTFAILKRLITVPFIALVNLIAQKKVVAELIQHQLTPAAIACEIMQLLEDRPRRARLLGQLARLRFELGRIEPSARVASIVAQALGPI